MSAEEFKCEGVPHDWADNERYRKNEKSTFVVVVLTAVTMVAEIAFGYWSGSLALLADGWHMATHAGALGITALAYRLARSHRLRSHLSFGTGKILPLAGYTSALLLALVAASMTFQSVQRLLHPQTIRTGEALVVTIAGLLVNVACVFLLRDGAHTHGEGEEESNHHHDLNLHGAFLHVIADAVTSILAIAALLCARWYSWNSVDPLVGLVGAAWIFKWAWGLVRDTAGELLDRHAGGVDAEAMRTTLEKDGAKVLDIHVWRLAPGTVACELIVESAISRGSEHYRNLVSARFGLHHLVVEERVSG